jgi:hypothetical protein
MLRRVAELFLYLGLVVAALSVFAAHPIFATGVWSDAEPIGIALYVAMGLCFTGLGFLSVITPAAKRYVLHPSVLVCMLLAAWSLLAAPFAAFPFLSVLGPPENSQGALWYIALAGFVASTMALRRNRALFGSLLAFTAAAALTAAFFNLSRIDLLQPMLARFPFWPKTTLLHFNEYQAYYALGLLPIAIILLGRHRWAAMSLLAVALIALLVSRNRSAMAAIGFIFLVSLLLRATSAGRCANGWVERHVQLTKALVAGAILIAALGPFLVVRFVDLLDVSGSLWSRQLLFKVVGPSLFDSFRSVLLGHGWGHYGEYLVRDLPSAGVSLFNSKWQAEDRDLFHSHNAAFEAFFAAGLPGIILALAIPITVVLTAQRRWRHIALGFALAWTVVDALWFMMPATMVALALAIGLLAESSQSLRLIPSKNVIAAVCAVLAFLGFGAAVTQLTYARVMTRLQSCLPPSSFAPACTMLNVPKDPRGSEMELASLLADSTSAAITTADKLPAPQRLLLYKTMKEARQRSAAGASQFLSVALVNAYAADAFTPAGGHPLLDKAELALLWPDEILIMLERAPQRLDVLSPYFNWLVLNQRNTGLRQMLIKAAAIDPTHPVVLWFSGLLLIGASDAATKEEGLELMRRALARGIERFLPIDDKIKSALAPGAIAR